MNNLPFAKLCFGDFDFSGAGSFVCADGQEFAVEWQKVSDGVFTASTLIGTLSLEVVIESARAIIKSGIQLTAPVRHLSYSVLKIRDFKFEHCVIGGIKMGRCNIFKAPVSEPVDFECYYNFTLSANGRSLVISQPLKQTQLTVMRGRVDNSALNLDVVYTMDHCSSVDVNFPDTTLEYGCPFEILQDYSQRNVEVKKEFQPPQYGWNSWDYYRWTVSEAAVLKNAEFIARDPVLSKNVKRIIIDDGWSYCYGEWHLPPWKREGGTDA